MNRQEEEEPSTTDKNCTTKQEQEQVSDMSAIPVAMDKVAAAALRSVLQRVSQAAEKAGRGSQQIRVVAVSKTKPVSLIKQLYDVGHRCFGENYAQEFIEKAPQVLKVWIFLYQFVLNNDYGNDDWLKMWNFLGWIWWLNNAVARGYRVAFHWEFAE